MKLDSIGKSTVTLNTAVLTKTKSLTTKQRMNKDRNCEYKVNLEMIVIKKKSLAYVRIFVKRADILNGIGIETG